MCHWKRCMYMYTIVSTYIYFECYWSGDLCIPVVRIAWKVLALSWKLRLSSSAKCYTMLMLASTGRYRKDVRKDGDNLPLRNTCVTNDHEYVPLVVSTFQYFSHSWLISDFVTGWTPRVLLVEQELLTFPGHVSSPPIFSFLCSIL
jgi:hypothetical protein